MANPGLLPPLTVPREALRPPSADNARVGLTMSVLAHAGLLAALTLGVSWRAETPTAVSAELWAATPQIAAPPRAAPEDATPLPPPEPATRPRAAEPPPPAAAEREAEIALEKARRLREDKARQEAELQREKARAEKERIEKERAEKAKAEKAARDKADKERQAQAERDKAEAARKDKAAEAQREKLRQDQIKRMNEQLGGGPSGNGAPGSTGTAARDAGPSASYAGRILARIKPNIVFTDEISGNPRAEVEMRVAPDGTIISKRITQSSGVKAWDDAVLRAIDRTAVLPRDTDGRVQSTMVIGFRPRD